MCPTNNSTYTPPYDPTQTPTSLYGSITNYFQNNINWFRVNTWIFIQYVIDRHYHYTSNPDFYGIVVGLPVGFGIDYAYQQFTNGTASPTPQPPVVDTTNTTSS